MLNTTWTGTYNFVFTSEALCQEFDRFVALASNAFKQIKFKTMTALNNQVKLPLIS